MARHKKEINIKLVAEEAGVSLATVSRVINNRTDVSEAMRRKVSAVVEKFNFAPTKGSERRINIGVIVVMDTSLVNEYISQVLDGVADYSDGGLLDVTVIFYRITPDAKPLLQLIRERRCDAVVLFPPERVTDQLPQLIESEIPVMLVNGSTNAPKMGFLNNESYTGAVKDDILDTETLGCHLMAYLGTRYPEPLAAAYKLPALPAREDGENDIAWGYRLLEAAGRKRGFLISGGEVDTERMAKILLDEFRGGKLGRFTLELPEDL